MIETIIIGATCMITGSIIGYLSNRLKKKTKRCECLQGMMTYGKEHLVRCELELFHDGPHMHTVSSHYTNEGEKVWWENKNSISSLLY